MGFIQFSGAGFAPVTGFAASQLTGPASLFNSFLKSSTERVITSSQTDDVLSQLQGDDRFTALVTRFDLGAEDNAQFLRNIANSEDSVRAIVDDEALLQSFLDVLSEQGGIAIPGRVAALTEAVMPEQAAFQSVWHSSSTAEAQEAERLSLSIQQREQLQRQWLLSSSLADGAAWSTQTDIDHLGGVSVTGTSEAGNLQSVSIASYDATQLIPETLLENPTLRNRALRQYFTERELNEDNLGQYEKALDNEKFYSRVAGLLSLKAATFRAAGLSLPGTKAGAGNKWTDVEYIRESYSEGGKNRYRRIRTFHGALEASLAGKGLFASFADEGLTGYAVVAVETEPAAAGIVSLGLDISDIRRWAAPDQAGFPCRWRSVLQGDLLRGATSLLSG